MAFALNGLKASEFDFVADPRRYRVPRKLDVIRKDFFRRRKLGKLDEWDAVVHGRLQASILRAAHDSAATWVNQAMKFVAASAKLRDRQR
jgi:hypothetical protein